MNVILFANTDWYLYNFRLPLARALRDQGYQVTLVSPAGEYAAKLALEGFRWREFNLSRRGMNPLREFFTLLALAQFYRQEKPQIVHHFTIKCVLYGSIAAKLTKTPLVINAVTGLGYIFSDGNKKVWLKKALIAFYRFALRNTQAIFQNPDDQALFWQLGIINSENGTLIRSSGINIHTFTPQPEPQGVPLVVLPARMLRDKGVEEFVAAARTLKEKGIHARFALVGDVDEGNPATVTAAELQIWQTEKVIEWWGWQGNMLQVYAQATLVCLPSYYGEGVPRTLLEAGACARALISANTPGCREIVKDGENGLLVPPRDIPALSAALEKLLLSTEERQQMAARSREIVVGEFAEEIVLAETLRLYQKHSTRRKKLS